MMKPAAQRRRGALGWVVVLLLAALALFTLVAVFSYLARYSWRSSHGLPSKCHLHFAGVVLTTLFSTQ